MSYELNEIEIIVSGGNLERFLNLCVQNNIYFKDISDAYDFAGDKKSFCASLDGFSEKEMRLLADKAGVQIEIRKRKGIWSRLLYYRSRVLFLAMPILVILYFSIMGQYVWGIEISGNKQITRDILLSYLEENGYGYGTAKENIHPEDLEFVLREDFPIITWVSVVLEGSYLKISIKENDTLLAVEDSGIVSANLIANEEGTIVSVLTRTGTPMVAAGTDVSIGDVLVLGVVPVYNNFGDTVIGELSVCADADIQIQTLLQVRLFESFLQEEKVYTGEEESFWYITFEDKIYSFYHWETAEDKDRFTSCHQLCIWDDFVFPIYYGTITEKSFYYYNFFLDEELVMERLQEDYEDYKENLLSQDYQILSEDIKYYNTGDGILLTGNLMVIKPTGEIQIVIMEETAEE